MSFFSELPGKQDKNAELLIFYMNKLIGSVKNYVRNIDSEGGKSASLLVVYNSYDNDIYCKLKSKHEEMQQLVGKHLPSSIILPSQLGSFGMEEFPFPMSQVITEIKNQLSLLGSKKNIVNIVTVPVYRHPYIGMFDKRTNYYKLKRDGACETIEIDLFW